MGDEGYYSICREDGIECVKLTEERVHVSGLLQTRNINGIVLIDRDLTGEIGSRVLVGSLGTVFPGEILTIKTNTIHSHLNQ